MRVFVLLVVLGVTHFSPVLATAPDSPASASPVSASWDEQRRIRTVDPRVKAAYTVGMGRSPAFREVVARVEARDVIVYIEMDPGIRGRLAGRMRWVAATKAARYVRVSLNPELSGPLLVATLAHELEHVAEVGDAVSIVDEATLRVFYRGAATERRARVDTWDTEAAQLTGETVRKQLAGEDTSAEARLVASRATSSH